MDPRDNLLCLCYHAFREHLHKHVKGKPGSVGLCCLMAGCDCNEFRLAPDQVDQVPSELLKAIQKSGPLTII